MARARPIGFFREATFLWEGQVSLFSEPLLLSEFQIKSVQKERANRCGNTSRIFPFAVFRRCSPRLRPEEIGALDAADAIVVRLAMTIPAGRWSIRRRSV